MVALCWSSSAVGAGAGDTAAFPSKNLSYKMIIFGQSLSDLDEIWEN